MFLKKLSLILLVVMVCVSFINCDSSDDDDDKTTNTTVNNTSNNNNNNNNNDNNNNNNDDPYSDYADGCTTYETVQDGEVIEGTQAECIEVVEDATVTLSGKVLFANGTEFKINPGVTLKANSSTETYLVIDRGAKINARGSALKPITFTSDKAAGTRGSQDWGGIVINGYADINSGLERLGEGNSGLFGGTADTDNSGIMRYVRVFFAGKLIAATNELNAIAMQGVGSGTIFEYIQTHNGADDGIEPFGGTFNMKYIVTSGNGDDQLDGTEGWRGKLQFVAIASVNKALGEDANNGDTGIEWDNNEDDNYLTPITNLTVYNISVLMSTDATAVKPRRGTVATFRNIYVAYDTVDNQKEDNCIISDDVATDVDVDYALLENCGPDGTLSVDAGTLTLGSNITVDNTLPTYIDPANYGSLADLAAAGDEAFVPTVVETGVTPPDDGFFDTTANFIGAVGSTNWMADWVEFPAN